MTTIERHLVINGEVSCDDDLTIEGTVQGFVSARDATVTIETPARVEADCTSRTGAGPRRRPRRDLGQRADRARPVVDRGGQSERGPDCDDGGSAVQRHDRHEPPDHRCPSRRLPGRSRSRGVSRRRCPSRFATGEFRSRYSSSQQKTPRRSSLQRGVCVNLACQPKPASAWLF